MKNIAICYSEHAVKVSDSYCPGNANQANLSPRSTIQDAVTCIYRVKLETKKRLFIRLTWRSRSKSNQLFSVSVYDGDPFSGSGEFSQGFGFGVSRGAKISEFNGLNIEVVWDLSRAEYDDGPEPTTGFYVIILVNSETSLVLGDVEGKPEARKRVANLPAAEFSLISRGEYLSGEGVYSARARFCETGVYHEILVKFSGEDGKTGSGDDGVLAVYVDQKRVVEMKRLRWNFRGNETVFLDGRLVDLLWDAHDWLFGPKAKGYGAVFLFRTRRGSDSRLWLDNNNNNYNVGFEENEGEKVGFSFVICASRNPD